MTFPDGVLAPDASVKGFALVGTDGRAGRVSWASYKPGESYLVVTTGRLRRAHHVVPAGVVASVSSREVHVGLTREQIRELPDLPHPQAPVIEGEDAERMLNAFERAWTVAGFPRS